MKGCIVGDIESNIPTASWGDDDDDDDDKQYGDD